MKKLFVILVILFCGFMFLSSAMVISAQSETPTSYATLSPITPPGANG